MSLERDSEPWFGRWDGVGEVRVAADGTYEVHPDPSTDHCDQLEAALRYGWAEPLSHARRGRWAAHGATLAPADSSAALLVTGDGHDTAIVVLGLVSAGWSVIADRPAPLEFVSDSVHAHPSSRPVVTSRRRARKMEFDGPLVRHDSDVVRLDDLPRVGEPVQVEAIVSVSRRRLSDPVITPVRGHAAIELLAKALHGGALRPDTDDSPAAAMARCLMLARCATSRLTIDPGSPDDTLSQLIAWWDAR